MMSTESGRESQPNTERPPADAEALRSTRSSEIVRKLDREVRSLRGPALIDATRSRIEGSRSTWTGGVDGLRVVLHADGRPVSPSLARFVELDPEWLSLPVDANGRMRTGTTLAAVVERCLDPELAFWMEGLEAILPGECYVLPTTTHDRCDVLFGLRVSAGLAR